MIGQNLTYILRASKDESRVKSVSRCLGKDAVGIESTPACLSSVVRIASEDVVRGIRRRVKRFGGDFNMRMYKINKVCSKTKILSNA